MLTNKRKRPSTNTKKSSKLKKDKSSESAGSIVLAPNSEASALCQSIEASKDLNNDLIKQTKRLARTLHPDADQQKLDKLIYNISCQNTDLGLNQLSQFLMTSPKNTLTTPVALKCQLKAAETTIVSRKWEEKFMHEPTGYERPCFNSISNNCFASTIPCNGVIDKSFGLCEFYTETEYEEIKANGWKWPQQQRLCILCCREQAFRNFVEVRCGAKAVLDTVVFTKIGNIIDQPGEYCKESCFMSSSSVYEGVLDPVVVPCVNNYRMHTINGIRTLSQLLPTPKNTETNMSSLNFFF